MPISSTSESTITRLPPEPVGDGIHAIPDGEGAAGLNFEAWMIIFTVPVTESAPAGAAGASAAMRLPATPAATAARVLVRTILIGFTGPDPSSLRAQRAPLSTQCSCPTTQSA